MALTAGISSSVRAWAPAYLHVAFGQAPAIAAALSSITWALATLSRLGAAAPILRVGSRRTIMPGIGLACCGLSVLLLSPNAIVATLAIAVVSIGVSPLFATCLALASEQAGRSPGAVAGLLLCAGGSGTVVCGWLFGLLLNTSGPTLAVLFCLALLLLAGLMALRESRAEAHIWAASAGRSENASVDPLWYAWRCGQLNALRSPPVRAGHRTLRDHLPGR
ncbi:MAG TPA: hypothetical protein VGF67_14765 [Ktedonobacteraceae bacterium]|jgi:fucose permease